MRNFELNREKAIELARQLGLGVTFDLSLPDIVINSGETQQTYRFIEFFPEMNNLDENAIHGYKHVYITKEESHLKDLASNLKPTIPKASKIVVNNLSSEYTKSSHLIGAA